MTRATTDPADVDTVDELPGNPSATSVYIDVESQDDEVTK